MELSTRFGILKDKSKSLKQYNFYRKLEKIAFQIEYFTYCLKYKSFKYWLLDTIWGILSINSEDYKGETAPYCGHGYSGYSNKYLFYDATEISGSGQTKFKIFGYYLCKNDYEGYYFWKP